MSTREELEAILGNPSEFVLSRENIRHLRQWAIAAGHSPLKVSQMTTVQLTNLYHETGDPNKPHGDLHTMLVRVMQTINSPIFSTTSTRIIALEEIRDEIENGDAIRSLVASELEKLTPKRLEVISERGSVMLDGMTHYKTENVIRVAGLGHPVMMVGPAGCGKTTIGEHTARALQLPFYITSTINEPHELTGFIDGTGKYHSTPFRHAFEHGGVWVADEIDAWDASALLTANAALANGYANFPDEANPIRRHNSFRMVATANTFGSGADRVYIGRNELDAASLDRFAVIAVDYDLSLERMFAGSREDWLRYVWKIRKKVEETRVRHVVSSRAIGMGSAALNAGLTWAECEEMYLFKGMSANDREKVK